MPVLRNTVAWRFGSTIDSGTVSAFAAGPSQSVLRTRRQAHHLERILGVRRDGVMRRDTDPPDASTRAGPARSIPIDGWKWFIAAPCFRRPERCRSEDDSYVTSPQVQSRVG